MRGLLAQPRVLAVAERTATSLARRFPERYTVAKLEYEVSAALRNIDDVRRVATLPNGARLLVPLWHETGRRLYFFGSHNLNTGHLYEPETTRFLSNWLRPGDTFIDIGANLGYYTLLASAVVGSSGAVFAFEPNETLVRWISESVTLNEGISEVVVNTQAIAEQTGVVPFYIPRDPLRDPRASLIVDSYSDPVATVMVSSITLDDYVVQHGITSIRLIKIDVEGAEDRVLAGSAYTLREIRPEAVILEHAPELLQDPEGQWSRVSGSMLPAGYIPYSITMEGELRELGRSTPSNAVQNVCFTRA